VKLFCASVAEEAGTGFKTREARPPPASFDLVRGGAATPAELPAELPEDPPDLLLAEPLDPLELDLDTGARDPDPVLGEPPPDGLAATTSGCSVDILAATLSEKQKSLKAGSVKIRYLWARQGQAL